MAIFDITDGDIIFNHSGNMGIDSDGDVMMRMGDNMAMDLETGEMHIVSGWKDDNNDF